MKLWFIFPQEETERAIGIEKWVHFSLIIKRCKIVIYFISTLEICRWIKLNDILIVQMVKLN